jgi:hypothetical protein
VNGRVGPRVTTVFSRIGPTAIGVLVFVLYVTLLVPLEMAPADGRVWPDAH